MTIGREHSASLELTGGQARCQGSWTFRRLGDLPDTLDHLHWPAGEIVFDLTDLQRMDTAGAWVLQRLRNSLEHAGHPVRLHNTPAEAGDMMALVAVTGTGFHPYRTTIVPSRSVITKTPGHCDEEKRYCGTTPADPKASASASPA